MKELHSSRAAASLLIAGVLLVVGNAAFATGRAGGAEPPAAKANSQAAKAIPQAAATGHEGHDMTPTVKGVLMTITGEVMDPACFLEAGPKSIGPGHFQCAVDCARSGQTLAIYDRVNDRIYFIAGELPGRNPNEPLMDFIHKKVDVTGAVYHRSSAYGIVIKKVVLHKEKG
jgi:hypothetical protein